jgi:hypothetical protein
VRKLELLPEVLPEPKRLAAGAGENAGDGDVRGRTLAHLQRLLATAAASGSLLGCTRGSVAPSADTRDPATTATPTGIPPAAESARIDLPEAGEISDVPPAMTAPTSVPPPVPHRGYAVVDPVPYPAACPALAGEIHATATWSKAGSSPAVDVRLSRVTGGPDVLVYGHSASVIGGTARSTNGGATLRMVVEPVAGTTSIAISIPARCNGRPVTVDVGLDVSAAAAIGSAVPVSVNTY